MGGKGGSKKVTVGYRYSWTLQAGLGRGPLDEIVAISADKKTVFAGTPGQLSQNTAVYIDKPNLFGGEDTGGEGGIQGMLEVMMGTADQVPTARLKNLLSGLIPGFRGIATTVYDGLISCYSPSPKPWSYRVRRTVKGWDSDVWNPQLASIMLSNTESQLQDEDSLNAAQKTNLRAIHAMNPAHILMECATNRDWGRGLEMHDIDEVRFHEVAQTLYQEGFGLCLRYNRQTSLDNFVQQILDHIGGVQYGDLRTGKLVIKLLRDDYVAEDLPLMTYDSGILAVQDDDSTSADAAPNEVVVTWHCPVTHADGEVRAQNLGAIQSVGLISSSADYRGLPTHALAARVAQRDLEISASGLTRLVLELDRRGGQFAPGSVFRLSLSDRAISNMIVRVGSIEEKEDGRFYVKVVQDIFGLPSTSYSSGDQGSAWQPPNKAATPVTDSQCLEVPYGVLAAQLSAAELAALEVGSGFLAVLATPPNAMAISYRLQTRSPGLSWEMVGEHDWTMSTALHQRVDALTTVLSADIARAPEVGSLALLGDEWVRIDAVDWQGSTVTVGRGCLDSLPRPHPAGTLLRFLDVGLEGSAREYMENEQVDVRLLTRTSGEILDASRASITTLTLTGRHSRPYLPGRISLNGVLYPEVVVPAALYHLQWAPRDRLLQADQLIDATMGGIGPEPGVRVYVSITPIGEVLPAYQSHTIQPHLTLPYESRQDGKLHQLALWCERAGRRSSETFYVTLPAGAVITELEEPHV
ncbi:hypothetical protein ACF1CY_000724 [Providencia rettgeri]